MWTEPYLETCCRSSLHRLILAGAAGRPVGLADEPCLKRLVVKGLALTGEDGRFQVTDAGLARHRVEILGERLPSPKQERPGLRPGPVGA